jgi:hypothetical protein
MQRTLLTVGVVGMVVAVATAQAQIVEDVRSESSDGIRVSGNPEQVAWPGDEAAIRPAEERSPREAAPAQPLAPAEPRRRHARRVAAAPEKASAAAAATTGAPPPGDPPPKEPAPSPTAEGTRAPMESPLSPFAAWEAGCLRPPLAGLLAPGDPELGVTHALSLQGAARSASATREPRLQPPEWDFGARWCSRP